MSKILRSTELSCGQQSRAWRALGWLDATLLVIGLAPSAQCPDHRRVLCPSAGAGLVGLTLVGLVCVAASAGI